MTNREIGTSLTISTRTVETHVEHLLAKLGVSRRAAIASETIRNDEPPVTRASSNAPSQPKGTL
jgi:DNA-binding NarL/FixJ family response regulator